MDKSIDYKHFLFDSTKSILYHFVTEDNIKDNPTFINSMSYLTTLIDKHHPKKMFIQIFSEPHYFEDNLPDFMKSTVSQVIKNVGIKKIAVYIKNTNFINDLKSREKQDSLNVRIFSTIDEAEDWLALEEN
jgi:hypothetical protein